jgi:hypothetical protein
MSGGKNADENTMLKSFLESNRMEYTHVAQSSVIGELFTGVVKAENSFSSWSN